MCAAEQNRYRKTASRISRSRSLMRPRPGTAGRSNLEKLAIEKRLLKRARKNKKCVAWTFREKGGHRVELSFYARLNCSRSGYFIRYEVTSSSDCSSRLVSG